MTMRNVGDLLIDHRNSSAGITFETFVLFGLTELVRYQHLGGSWCETVARREMDAVMFRLRKRPQRECVCPHYG